MYSSGAYAIAIVPAPAKPMACAISGARLGVAAIPRHLVDRLENGPLGRDYIDRLAVQLYQRLDEEN